MFLHLEDKELGDGVGGVLRASWDIPIKVGAEVAKSTCKNKLGSATVLKIKLAE